MRDFSWKYFTNTGDVESYLLFKEIDKHGEDAGWNPDDDEIDEGGTELPD